MRKNNKLTYLKVIQQNYGQGWEDVSEYETDSQGNSSEKSGKFVTLSNGRTIETSLIKHDLKEYRLTGYPTRLISRKVIKLPPVEWPTTSAQ